MKKIVFFISLILTPIWTQKCDNKFPGLTKPPAINHSNPGNQPSITTCRKGSNDQFYFCRCFDNSGAEVLEGQKAQATSFCCQCPETLDEKYSIFEDITFGSGDVFSFNLAREIAIQRCPKISIKSLPKVEKIEIEHTVDVTFQTRFNLPELKKLSINGHKKPIKYDQDIGTTVTISEGILGSVSRKPEVTMTNTRITQFPRQMKLASLIIETSLFPDTKQKIFPNINSTSIDELQIKNSDILSVFKLGLSSYPKPFTFSSNKIYSSCQTSEDNQKCFLHLHNSSVYEANKIQCSCNETEGDECVSKDKAITKFDCPGPILKNTMCSDLHGEKTLEYLKIEEVSAPCEEFEYALSVLEIPKIPTDDPPPLAGQEFPIWIPIVLSILAILIIIVSIILIVKLKQQGQRRRKSKYVKRPEDDAPEGIEVSDDSEEEDEYNQK